jgi:hypothetical protein
MMWYSTVSRCLKQSDKLIRLHSQITKTNYELQEQLIESNTAYTFVKNLRIKSNNAYTFFKSLPYISVTKEKIVRTGRTLLHYVTLTTFTYKERVFYITGFWHTTICFGVFTANMDAPIKMFNQIIMPRISTASLTEGAVDGQRFNALP